MRENAEKMLRAKKDEMQEIQKEIKKDETFKSNGLNQKPNEDEKPKMAESPLKEGVKLTLTSCSNLNIRKKPIKDNVPPLTIVDKYDDIEFISKMGDDWLKVKVKKEYKPNTRYIGYAMSKFLTRVE